MPDAYQRLPCKLSQREKDLKSDELAREMKQYGLIEARKAAATKALGEELKKSRAKLDDLSMVVRDGVEYREVPVIHRKVFADRNVIETWRTDTNDLVSTRPMEPHERQAEMFSASEKKAHEDLTGLYSSKAGPQDEDDDEDDAEAVEH
jgi:hypothetical protein